MSHQYGFDWRELETTHIPSPVWNDESHIEKIKSIVRRTLPVEAALICEVTLHTIQGTRNKLYRVNTADRSLIMRVVMPIDPHHKTISEVATMEFVRNNTGVPIPVIIAFSTSVDSPGNEPQFEWILMEMEYGVPLYMVWPNISWIAKRNLVKLIARYQAELFKSKFLSIGSIHTAQGFVDRLVSKDIYYPDNINRRAPLGPFNNSQDWQFSRTQNTIHNLEHDRLYGDEHTSENAQKATLLAQLMLKDIPWIYPVHDGSSEMTTLFHDSLDGNHIMVNQFGSITAILGWAHAAALPSWKACQLPRFLSGPFPKAKPCLEDYHQDDEMYWRLSIDHELAQLKHVYVEEMKIMDPSWVMEHQRTIYQRVYDFDLLCCSHPNVFGSSVDRKVIEQARERLVGWRWFIA